MTGIAFDYAGQRPRRDGHRRRLVPQRPLPGRGHRQLRQRDDRACTSPKPDPLQFFDAAIATGLGPPTRLSLTFGVFFFDYDLDGRLDLLSANGHLEEDINKVQPTQYYAQPPQLFWNCGPEQSTEFVPVPPEKCGEDFGRRMVGRGSAFADIDGDGDLDVVITASGGAPRLLRNDQQTGPSLAAAEAGRQDAQPRRDRRHRSACTWATRSCAAR